MTTIGGVFGTDGSRDAKPADKWRNKKPANLDQAEWDKLLDELNAEYNAEKKKTLGVGKSVRMDRIERMQLEDVIGEGQRSGTITKDTNRDKKRGAVEEVKNATGETAEDAKRRQAELDAENAGANTQDDIELARLKTAQLEQTKAKHGIAAHQRADADAANKNSRDILAGMGKDFSELNAQDQNALAKYLSETDPMMAEIFARTSDPADIQRQLDAYTEQQGVADKYKSLTDPQVTAKERYMSELARREFEEGDRSSRAATSEALANRGLRSGGQQIAGQQQSMQQLSQDRLLKELGIQAGAVDRSMKAMEGWNTATGNLGLQSAAIRDANDSQRQYEDDFKAKDAERRSKLAGERKDKSDDTTGDITRRDETYANTGLDVEDTVYGRNTGSNKIDWDTANDDYKMAGDYYAGATGTSGRRVQRAQSGLDSGIATGDRNVSMLADSLGLGINEITDEEEHDLVARHGGA
jgi:hypothetical protein